jgi:hypothetical protein
MMEYNVQFPHIDRIYLLSDTGRILVYASYCTPASLIDEWTLSSIGNLFSLPRENELLDWVIGKTSKFAKITD